MKRWWLSWYHTRNMSPYTIHSPWWISGARVKLDTATGEEFDEPTVCAAVIAPTEKAAKAAIIGAYDIPPAKMEWRFCEERADDWSPFSDRFPEAKWMQWR